ncbi:hypothetical protein B9N43_04415 [Denitratisoma sp. DHT3]|nr:hypothetical protein B9N43_04415 [Denitratisoma sp. DHT3]
MPTSAEMKAVMTKYASLVSAGDAEAVVALYADNATIEDPVGSPAQSGREAIAKFYQGACASGVKINVLSGPYGSFGNSAAMVAEVLVEVPGLGPSRIELVEVMEFDAQGKISAMRAYWGQEDMKPV